jgi:hypothetical protein
MAKLPPSLQDSHFLQRLSFKKDQAKVVGAGWGTGWYLDEMAVLDVNVRWPGLCLRWLPETAWREAIFRAPAQSLGTEKDNLALVLAWRWLPRCPEQVEAQVVAGSNCSLGLSVNLFTRNFVQPEAEKCKTTFERDVDYCIQVGRDALL